MVRRFDLLSVVHLFIYIYVLVFHEITPFNTMALTRYVLYLNNRFFRFIREICQKSCERLVRACDGDITAVLRTKESAYTRSCYKSFILRFCYFLGFPHILYSANSTFYTIVRRFFLFNKTNIYVCILLSSYCFGKKIK